MANKKKEVSKDNIYLVLNLVLSVVTMSLVAALISRAMAEDIDKTSLFFGLTIFSLILFQILLFAVKERKREKLRAIVVGIMYIIAMAVAFLATAHYILFYISSAIVTLAMAVNQFMLIEKAETKKGMITNILLGIVLVGLTIAIFTEVTEKDAVVVPLLVAILLLLSSFKKILFPTLKLEKVKLLLNILIKTHTIDVIICLVAFVIAFSFILPRVEGTITNFWDAMWYCFTVITTIGFGDFAATSAVGRILTVILGIYGIVVVAIITSVIVNFYNEVSANEKARDFIE